MVLVLFTAGCKKDPEMSIDSTDTSTDLLIDKSGGQGGHNGGVAGPTDPADSVVNVPLNQVITVYFNDEISPSQIAKSKITLKKVKTDNEGDDDDDDGDDDGEKSGDSSIEGTTTYTDSTASFTPAENLTINTSYKATVTTKKHDNHGHDSNNDKKGYSWHFSTGTGVISTNPSVSMTDPLNNATGVAFNKAVVVTFSMVMDPLTINASTFTLKQGTTAIAGTVTYTGTKATFTPFADLAPNKIYTGTITTGAMDLAGNALLSNYIFNFTTGATADITLPIVTLTDPINNATGVAFNKAVVVTFSEAMNPITINASTFTLKQGATAVAGTITYTGTKATFTPTGSMAPNQIYTGTITTGANDLAGNALLSNYTFSFTTGTAADITLPTVTSTDPLNGATGVALNKVVGATFSEAMTASSISTSTFTIKQGTTTISGTVAYSGTTATFTPSNVFAAGTIYTATMTTGAKDLAGNALAANKVWSFTTIAPVVVGQSFAGDVVPVLAQCQACHTHGWTPSTNASTYYTNLVSSGYVTPSAYTTSKIYKKLAGGHPGTGSIPAAETDKILNWMIEGSLNN